MAGFLSAEWIEDLAAAADGASAPEGVELVVQQVVVDEHGTEVAAYAVRVVGGKIAVVPGRAGAADVTFTQDAATAEAIARGEMPAQRAFLEGRLRVGGDLSCLLDAGRALADLDDVFASARASTGW